MRPITVIGAALSACFASVYAESVSSPGSLPALSAQVTVLTGTRYAPSPILNRTEEPDEEEELPFIPTGSPIGPIVPSSPAVNLTAIFGRNSSVPSLVKRNCGGSNIEFGTTSVIGSGGPPLEPSGAKAGKVIFTTRNWFASVSVDNGATFHQINPTVYSGPADALSGGFCCDQVVHYIPKINRFVWLIQYVPTAGGINKLRIISFCPEDVDANGINSWLFLDIFSGTVGLSTWMDYGDMSVGDNSLYVSATAAGVGLIVIRVPFFQVAGPLTLWYTDPTLGDVATFSHLSQNPGNTVFWAGHTVLGTTMRIFRWPESGTTYFWSDIRIGDWPADPNNFVSFCPNNGPNWVFNLQFHDVIGATRRRNDEVWFAWPAPSGSGFPHLHVQVVQINPSNWPALTLVKQWQIWNPNFAFAYPAFYTNDCGDVGIAVAFGGGQYFPTGAVGIADGSGVLGSTVWYPALSDFCDSRWGDYLTVRSAHPDGIDYAGFIYSQSTAEGRAGRYIRFGRT